MHNDALVNEVFKAKQDNSAKGDFVKQELVNLNITLTFPERRKTLKQGFEDIVKEKVKPSAINMLTQVCIYSIKMCF